MRTKNSLFNLQNIAILLQYLYMDKDNIIDFNNGMANIKIKMTEYYQFQEFNYEYPDIGWIDATEAMTIPVILNIIDILKKTPSHYKFFKTEWEEIKKKVEKTIDLNLGQDF